MTGRHPELKRYGNRWLAFPGEFLGSKGGDYAPAPTEDEREASRIIRETAATTRNGRPPIPHLHEVTRRALNAIKRDGIETFIEKHTKRESEAA